MTVGLAIGAGSKEHDLVSAAVPGCSSRVQTIVLSSQNINLQVASSVLRKVAIDLCHGAHSAEARSTLMHMRIHVTFLADPCHLNQEKVVEYTSIKIRV